MEQNLRAWLKATRLAQNVSVRQAAQWAGVTPRTWLSYETAGSSISARQPPQRAIRSFFRHAGIPVPPHLYRRGSARALAFTNYKGGVGKSPITINVATGLLEMGFKVAVISSDVVFRCVKIDGGRGPKPATLVSRIDFFDELDVLFAKSEITELKRKKKRDLNAAGNDQYMINYLTNEFDEKLRRKRSAIHTYQGLCRDYDFIFLDVGWQLELIRKYADAIALVLDTDCADSIRGAKRYISDIRRLRGRRSQPHCVGLLTKFDIGGNGTNLLAMVSEYVEINEADYGELQTDRFEDNDRRECILRDVKSLGVPLMRSRLTKSHVMVIERYCSTRGFKDSYGYYNSVLDAAPNSYAAEEIRDLSREVLDLLH